jgi:hypothetical protein
VTPWETNGGHGRGNMPEDQEPIRIPRGSHKEQNTSDSVEHCCIHGISFDPYVDIVIADRPFLSSRNLHRLN